MGDIGSETPQLELVRIPNGHMLVPDDQLQAAVEAIATFAKKVGKR